MSTKKQKKSKLDKIAKILGADKVIKLKGLKSSGPIDWLMIREVHRIIKELRKLGIEPKGYNLKSPYERKING